MQYSQISVSDQRSSAPALPHLLKLSKCFSLVVGVISVLASVSLVPTAMAAPPSETVFDWHKITPSPNLSWVKCYGIRECARLEVPLDYSDHTGDKAAVALLRVKAKVSPHSKKYRGPVLFNPGGPGLSGIQQVLFNGGIYQQVLGEEYDIIGFDPRGIGETTPIVSIFSDDAERAAWDAGAPPLLNSTPDALPQAFVRAQLSNALVESRSKRAAEHVSTAVVARDMLSITKAHGRDRLQYWGFSYGSVLGATYAAMFPDKVERLIIDGVVNLDDYYAGTTTNELVDSDKVLQFFYERCASAGALCPLHANSSALVQQRVEALFASIKANPMPVINGTDYAIIDFTILKRSLLLSVYSPFSRFPLLAEAFAALERGDGVPFLTLWRTFQPLPKCNSPPPTRDEAGRAVLCGEAERVPNTTSEIMEHFETQSRISSFADTWIDDTLTSCVGWKVRLKERFAGPFEVNTSFPLLLIGNTADPVTPLVSAQKVARIFGGSVLLTINTPGHTSEAVTSVCAQKIIRSYFSRGQLPAAGTVCEIESVLFAKPAPSRNVAAREVKPAERIIESLTRSYRALRGWVFV